MDNKTLKKISVVGVSSINVLVLVVEKLGYQFSNVSYRKLATLLGMSYANVKYHFGKLEKFGYLKIEKISPQKAIYTIDRKKFSRLLNE